MTVSGILYILYIQAIVILLIQVIHLSGGTRTMSKNKLSGALSAGCGRDTNPMAPWDGCRSWQ